MIARSRSSSPPQGIWVASALALVSMCIRIVHLGWGLPELEEEAFPLRKAFEMCGWGDGKMILDPETAGWPSLSFYIHMVIQYLHYWFGRLTGLIANRQEYYLLKLDWTSLVLVARFAGVTAAAGIVFVGTKLGHRLAGLGGALLVGLFLTASPLLLRYAQLITPDIFLSLFAAFAVWKIVDVYFRGLSRDYIWAGIWIGLGISCKYTPVLLIPALYVAHMMRSREKGVTLRWLGLRDCSFWVAILACCVAFALTSPFVLAHPNVLQRDLDYQVFHLQRGHFGMAGPLKGYLYYLRNVFGPALGWPGLLLASVGLILAAWRSRGAWLILLLSFLPFYIILGSLSTYFDRYMLPALMPLSLGLAGCWYFLRTKGGPRSRRITIFLLIMVSLSSSVFPAHATWRYLRRAGNPSTLQLARKYIEAELGSQDPYLAMELYTPAIPRDKQLALRLRDPVLNHLNEEQRRRFLDLDVFHVVNLVFYTTRPHYSDFYYDLRHFMTYDYIVTSSAVRSRYEARPATYPRQIEFYGDLEKYTRLVKTISPHEYRRGPEIRIYQVTEGTREALLRDKPLLTTGFYREYSDHLVASHFVDFMATIGDHAFARGYLYVASQYYQALYETQPPAGRKGILRPLAISHLRIGKFEEAKVLFRELLALEPEAAEIVGYLGYTLAELGERDAAIHYYQRFMELAAGSDDQEQKEAWARERIEELEGRTSTPR